jgi:1,4-dihydroxy-2-naphthoate octaprenyltransferase
MNNFKHYFLASRPAFLTISLLACSIGFAIAAKTSLMHWGVNSICLFLVLLAHAAANLSNDYFDSLNGSDARNTKRIYPYTGGSRYIQNNHFNETQINLLSLGLFIAVILGGLALCLLTNWRLIWIGFCGLLLAWFYSAPPLKLMCRGLWGELAIVCAWALVVIGSSMLSTSDISMTSLIVGSAYGLMVANILFVNQIPDIEADQLSGKLTLAVSTQPQNLWMWSLAFSAIANLLILVSVGLDILSKVYLLALMSFPLSYSNALKLVVVNHNSLKKCIQKTILATHLFGLLILISIVMDK